MLTKGNVVVGREDLADDGATSFEDVLEQCKNEELSGQREAAAELDGSVNRYA